jgi:hypothetical protein
MHEAAGDKRVEMGAVLVASRVLGGQTSGVQCPDSVGLELLRQLLVGVSQALGF